MSSSEQENSPNPKSIRHIAIIGAGSVGLALATQLVAAGHFVTISNSRGPGSLREEELKTGATAADPRSALKRCDTVILAVWLGKIELLQSEMRGLAQRGVVVIDACNYFPSRDGHIEPIENGMPESVWVSEMISVSAVKGFNSIIASNIVSSARSRNSLERSALPVASDNENALSIAMELVEDVGFDAYNSGSLGASWRQQPGQPAYCVEPTLKQLPGLLARANRKKAAANRDKAMAIVERLPANYLSADVMLRVSRLSAGLDVWRPRSWLAAMIFATAIFRAWLNPVRKVK